MCELSGGLGDLGLGGGPSQPPQQRQQPSFQDPFGAPAPTSAAGPPAEQDLPVLLSADKAKGLTLRGQIARMDGRIGECQHSSVNKGIVSRSNAAFCVAQLDVYCCTCAI